MRRVLGLLAAVSLLAVTLPATTMAAKPVALAGAQTGILCEIDSEAGFISLTVQASGEDGIAFMALWAPGTEPYEDLPTAMSATSRASLYGSSLRAAFELVSGTEEERSTGSASLGVELTASGAPMVWTREGSDGNRRFRIEQITQLLTVEGTLIVDLHDGTHDEVDLSGCGASTDSSSFFATNPNSWVYGGKQVFVSCEWATDDGNVSLFGLSDESMALSQLVVVTGDRVLLGIGEHVLSPTTYRASFELMDLTSGQMAGAVNADATLSPSGERIAEHVRVDPYRLSTVGVGLTVEGTLDVSVDGTESTLDMDAATCRAGDVRVQVQEKISHR